MRLIAFTGGYGVGKSTAVQILDDLEVHLDSSRHVVHLLKFADPLYDIQEYAYRRISSVYKRPADFAKDRKLLQWIGTEWGRDTLSSSLWVDLWKEEVRYAQENYPHKLIVTDDCRFDNEAAAVKSMGGIIVKLVRTNTNPEGGTGIQGHKSEAGIDRKYIDFIVYNDTSVDDLKVSLKEIYAGCTPGEAA